MSKTIGTVLKEKRRELGLTLSHVSSLAGMSTSQLAQLEGGVRKKPSFETISRVAHALRVSLDEIAAACGLGAVLDAQTPSETVRRTREAQKAERRLLKAVKQLSDLTEGFRQDAARREAADKAARKLPNHSHRKRPRVKGGSR